MSCRPIALLAVVAFTASPAIAAKVPLSLAHTTKWEMNYGEDVCTLASRFGEGKDSVLLVLNRFDPGDGFEMKLYSEGLRHEGLFIPIEVAFGEQPLQRYDGMSATATDAAKTPTVIIGGMRLDGWRRPGKTFDPAIAALQITLQQEAAINSLTFSAQGRKPVQLRTGSMAPVMEAMRNCTDDLLRHWGFDPAVQATLKRPAQPLSNPGTWLHSGDYPYGSLINGENGLVRFRLDVESDGSVSACRILYRTNPDSFADLSCKLLQQRARFGPALDAQGKPVKSYFLSQVRWVMEGSGL